MTVEAIRQNFGMELRTVARPSNPLLRAHQNRQHRDALAVTLAQAQQSSRVDVNFPHHIAVPVQIVSLCGLNGVQYRLVPTLPKHKGITFSFFYHDAKRLSEVVAEMSYSLSVQGHVAMHVLMDATTLLHVMGSDGPHAIRSHITDFEARWSIRISMDRISHFVLLSGAPFNVSACLLHLLPLFVRATSDPNPLHWTIGHGGKATRPPFLLS